MGFFKKKDSATSYGFRSLLELNKSMNMIFTSFKGFCFSQHFVSFMGQLFEKGHAEIAPPLATNEECWFLPIFGVYHPKKPGQIRVVFDSATKHDNISLNDVLLSGPDMTNSLLGILLRFRKDTVAVTADAEKMFYTFHVKNEHRNFLRFLWYRDNDPSKDLIEYRMKVHVFGNSLSPACNIWSPQDSS